MLKLGILCKYVAFLLLEVSRAFLGGLKPNTKQISLALILIMCSQKCELVTKIFLLPVTPTFKNGSSAGVIFEPEHYPHGYSVNQELPLRSTRLLKRVISAFCDRIFLTTIIKDTSMCFYQNIYLQWLHLYKKKINMIFETVIFSNLSLKMFKRMK